MEDLDEDQRAELRAKRREARKEMERERRKAIKAAYKRLRDSKKKPEDVSAIYFNFTLLFFFQLIEYTYFYCIQFLLYLYNQILYIFKIAFLVKLRFCRSFLEC